jgi:quercetin dioxygenase-like cupin family protein
MMIHQDSLATAAVGHVAAGGGRSRWVVGDTYTFKATKESTGGRFGLLEASIPPGAGPPPHVHSAEDESFYLLAGGLQISAGTETFLAQAGDFVFLPRNTLHCFTNPGAGAARTLILITPGGFERFFDEVGSPARSGDQAPPPTAGELARLAEVLPRYGARIQVPGLPTTAHQSGPATAAAPSHAKE